MTVFLFPKHPVHPEMIVRVLVQQNSAAPILVRNAPKTIHFVKLLIIIDWKTGSLVEEVNFPFFSQNVTIFVANPTLLVHCFTRVNPFCRRFSDSFLSKNEHFFYPKITVLCTSILPQISQKTCSISYSLVLNLFKFWIVQDATEAYTGFSIRVRA